LQKVLLPFTCVICQKKSDRSQDICQSCLAKLPFYQNDNSNTYILFRYQPPVTDWLIQLKFYRKLIYTRIIGELFANYLQQNLTELPDAIIPIPLHFSRIKQRGYNQSVEIARPISQILKRRILLDSCERRKSTSPQTTLSAAEREINLQNAFVISQDFSGQHLAVLDDVMTTGSTIQSFCQLLGKHGAKQIDVWCCARGILNQQKP